MGLHHTTSAYFNIFCVGYINFTAGLIIIFILLLFLLLTSLKAILYFPKKGMSFISWMCRSNACIMWCVSSDRACYMVITYSLSTVVDTNRPFWTLLTYQVQHWHILPPCGSIQASPIQDQDTLLFDTICAKVYASSLENVKKNSLWSSIHFPFLPPLVLLVLDWNAPEVAVGHMRCFVFYPSCFTLKCWASQCDKWSQFTLLDHRRKGVRGWKGNMPF